MPRLGSIYVSVLLLIPFALWGVGCETQQADDDDYSALPGDDADTERPPPPEHLGTYGFANGCYAMDAAGPGEIEASFLVRSKSGEAFQFTASSQSEAARFFMRPTDLGIYLFYDEEQHYLIAEEDESGDWELRSTAELFSDILLIDDTYVSPAEWELLVSPRDERRFQLRHFATGRYLTTTGLSENEEEAAVITFYPLEGCAEFPELTLDAVGHVEPRQWEDGDVFGIAETHAHMFANFAFGGGGILHGAPFHRLGVEHALPSCELFHGAEGRKDLVGLLYNGESTNFDTDSIFSMLLTGETPSFNHHTEGYPEFTDWPSSWGSATHQTMYYRWVERAYLAGLRLLVQHAVSNSVLCDIHVATGIQDVRYSCNDMVAVDRSIEEVYNLERYIDAQSGGPNQGWFRIVHTPAQARQVINEGKLAVVLGIEVSNLFNCFLTPPAGYEACDADTVREQLDLYFERGIRAIFPVHKYDNAFSAGDGHLGIIELGNFINTGHYSNFTEDCPDYPTVYDMGSVTFGGLNRPRDDYLAPAPVDMSNFVHNPLGTLAPYLDVLRGPSLEGDYCQRAGLTELGEILIREMMLRGMIIEVDHLPRRAHARAFEILKEYDYPPAATHGNMNNGRVYQLGGITGLMYRDGENTYTGFDRCADPEREGSMSERYRSRIEFIIENGGYPAEGLGFDFNGFAFGPRPRFAENSCCSEPQENPVTYPFPSYAGDVTFSEPHLGNRTVDFNTEGMIHYGLLPEIIEEVRRDGMTDEELEPLFRSAEAYIRMWEKAEELSSAMRP